MSGIKNSGKVLVARGMGTHVAKHTVTTVNIPGEWRVFALDNAGRRLAELPFRNRMKLDNFVLPEQVIFAYEFVRRHWVYRKTDIRCFYNDIFLLKQKTVFWIRKKSCCVRGHISFQSCFCPKKGQQARILNCKENQSINLIPNSKLFLSSNGGIFVMTIGSTSWILTIP